AAVLDRVAGGRLAKAELFGATGGGLRVDDPGCDLAVAAAMASSATGAAPPVGAAFVGEISLTGAIRPVPGMAARLAAAARAGISTVFAPPTDVAAKGVQMRIVHHISGAVDWAGKEVAGGG